MEARYRAPIYLMTDPRPMPAISMLCRCGARYTGIGMSCQECIELKARLASEWREAARVDEQSAPAKEG